MEFPEFKLRVIKKYFDIEKEEDAVPVLFLGLQNNKAKLVRIPDVYLENKDKMVAEIDNIIAISNPKYIAFCAFSNVHKMDTVTNECIESIEGISMMFEDGIEDKSYTVTFEKTEKGYQFNNEFNSDEVGTEISGRFLKKL